MTRSKIDLAKILASLRNDGSDPEQLAKDMTLRRLCYEIELLETQVKEKRPLSFWARLTHDSDDE